MIAKSVIKTKNNGLSSHEKRTKVLKGTVTVARCIVSIFLAAIAAVQLKTNHRPATPLSQ